MLAAPDPGALAAPGPGAALPGSRLLAAPPPAVPASGAPLFAAIPGGNANVFGRALGLPTDPVDATGQILAALSAGRARTVGLGLAGDRYFCFNAGLGLDAEVVRVVEGVRARGRTLSPALYVWTAVRQFCSVTNRREPALTVERDGAPAMDALFFGIVSNASPWTYLGQRPVTASPGRLRHRPRPVRAAQAGRPAHAQRAAANARPGAARPAGTSSACTISRC